MARFSRTYPAPIVKHPYRDFRPFVQADFRRCCSYCCLHEQWAAGEENFQIDHFRPKSKFPNLINDFYNLYWSCAVCNSPYCKGDTWLTQEEMNKGVGFVDLCSDDFEDHYHLQPDGYLVGLTDSARYTIEKIRLNRKHLVFLRAYILSNGYTLEAPPTQQLRD